MLCHSCGKKLEETAKFCKFCGERVPEKQKVEVKEKNEEEIIVKPEISGRNSGVKLNEASQYISRRIKNPNIENDSLNLNSILCINGMISLVYILLMYVFQNKIIGTLIDMILRVDGGAYYSVIEIRRMAEISLPSTVIGGILLLVSVLGVVSAVIALNNKNKKESSDFVTILQEATHLIIVPSLFMVVSVVGFLFSIPLGLILFFVAIITLIMSISRIYKGEINYIAYITIAVATLVLLFITFHIVVYVLGNIVLRSGYGESVRVKELFENLKRMIDNFFNGRNNYWY